MEDDKQAARTMRRRAGRVRAAAAELAARSDATAASLMKEMLARQAKILLGGAESLERRALEIEPPDGAA